MLEELVLIYIYNIIFNKLESFWVPRIHIDFIKFNCYDAYFSELNLTLYNLQPILDI